ncbi:MAG: hypothetical protein DMF54_01390 [Acidobacteria bacterium]|nr:MAG: hypothetical protein DMF54_01390 [Acidobacteriota bacterium]
MDALSNDSGPPLFYLLEKPFVTIGERLSADVFARSLPFAATIALLVGVLALPSRSAKLRFVVLASISPLLFLYSAEARAYALLSLAVFLLFLLAIVLPERPGNLPAIALLAAVSLYLHYLALFAVAALILVAAAEKRGRSALAALAGSALFLFWIPIMREQPRQAVAWMHESAGELATGILASLGGAGRIPPPFGAPLPLLLVALGGVLGLVLASLLGRSWRIDPELRRTSAFLVLFFGSVLFASLARPVAFAGRTEMAVLPVWLWAIARAGEQSRFIRGAIWSAVAVASLSTVLLAAAPRGPSAAAWTLEALERTGRPQDVLFAGASFYLPARLAADRGRLAMELHAFPLEQASHPGWTVPRRSTSEDDAAVERALVRAGSAGRVFFAVPPSYRRELSPLLTGRGVTRRIVETPELVLLVWSPR